MRSIIFIVVLFICSVVSASEDSSILLRKFATVNKEWLSQKNLPTFENIPQQLKTENDWIAFHLSEVAKILSQKDVSHLSFSQHQNRKSLLVKLQDYYLQGVFPQNNLLPYRTPIFIDEVGTHCAVGFLMQQSGSEALAQKINQEQRFAYVRDIHVEGVERWAEMNGFTIDELAWIQPGYPPTTTIDNLGGGLNGRVNAIAAKPDNSAVFFGGLFSQSKSGMNFQNIGVWQNGFAGYSWTSIGGVNGEVFSLLYENDKLYVGGKFSTAGSVNAKNVAYYDFVSGQWNAIGSIDSTVRTLTFYKGALYAGGDFADLVLKWNGSNWLNINNGLLAGNQVRTFEVWDGKLVMGGDLDLTTGALRRHVAIYDGTQMGTLGFGTPTPVNDFEEFNGKLYAACDFVRGVDTCALAIYDTTLQTWETALKPYALGFQNFGGNSIRSLAKTNSILYAGGDFNTNYGMTRGAHLARIVIDPNNSDYVCIPTLALNEAVYALDANTQFLYLGGDFTQNSGTTLGYAGTIQAEPNLIIEVESDDNPIVAYPIPSTNSISFESKNTIMEQIEIYDVSGKQVLKVVPNGSKATMSIYKMSTGLYTAKVTRGKTTTIVRFIKQ